jgi:RNA polymerase sigma-70 factor (ECF subfamily)
MKNKEKEHLELAWKEYSDKLLSFIRSKVNSKDDSEEILADVFLKLAKQAELSRSPHNLSGWLYHVTRNSIIDHYRTKKSMEQLPDNLMQDHFETQAISTLAACIIPIIEELPSDYKLPILLSEIQGKTQKQVAKELGLSLPAVKSRILRGRKRLKDLMSKRCTFYYGDTGQLVDYKEKSKGCRHNPES